MDVLTEHKSQLAFLFIGMGAIPLTLRFMIEIHSVRAWLHEHQEPPYGWPAFSDFKITIVSAILCCIANYVVNRMTWSFFYEHCKEKKVEETRNAKTVKATNSFYKGLYFIFAVVWGYLVLQDSKFLPPSLLGSGDMLDIHKNYPNVEWPQGLKAYYLGTMGYHLHQFFVHAI